MIRLGTQLRFSEFELDTLRRLCGPVFRPPRTVSDYEKLLRAATAYWREQGDPSRIRTLLALLTHPNFPEKALPRLRIV